MAISSKSHTITKRPIIKDGQLILRGSYTDYNIEIKNDVIKIEDMTSVPYSKYEFTGLNDGLIKFLAFEDLRRVSIIDKTPYHVSDIIDLLNMNPLEIPASTLLENDKDFRNSKLSIFTVKNPVGCQVKLLKDGNISITPDANFDGIKSFEYTIKNELGFKNTNSIKVYLREPHHPNDPKFFEQWYLQEMNVIPVWNDYSGKGVKIAILDEGFIPLNPDVEIHNNPYETKFDNEALGQHGLMVASVIGAKHNNTIGMAGIAFNANITSAQFPFVENIVGSTNELAIFSDFDIINNSWSNGYKCPSQKKPHTIARTLEEDFNKEQNHLEAIESAVINGRKGKGSIIVFAGGNKIYADANLELGRVNPYNIIVGGFSKPKEQLSKFEVEIPHFASTSALTLVAAPASHFLTTHQANLVVENNQISGQPKNTKVEGTSFASPSVAATVGLMLEANPNLGWRDVQDILAYSALPKNGDEFKYSVNGAKNSNGGGLMYNKEYGFGIVNTFGAVRLAEVWENSNTFQNYNNLVSSPKIYNDKTYEGNLTETFVQDEDIEIEFLRLELVAQFTKNDSKSVQTETPSINERLKISITSPQNRTYTVIKDSGYNPSTKEYCFDFGNGIDWNFGLQHARGELGKGNWNVTISLGNNKSSSSNAGLSVIKPVLIGLDFYGKPKEHFSKEIIYTSFFNKLDGEDRHVIKSDSPFNTINTVAISTPVTIDLSASSKSIIDGQEIILKRLVSSPFHDITAISNIKSGDGDDMLRGNDGNNIIMPGRGNDNIYTEGGEDIIWYPNLNWSNLGHDVIHDFDIRRDKLKIGGTTYSEIQTLMTEKNTCHIMNILCIQAVVIGNNEWSIELQNVAIKDLSENNFILD